MASYSSELPLRWRRENGAGMVNCQRIIHHLQVDLHPPASRLVYPCWDGKVEMNEEVPETDRLDRLPAGFASAHFPPSAGSLAHVTPPFV